MTFIKDNKLFSSLSEPIYTGNKQVKEIWISNNGVPTKIYPMGQSDYWWYVVESTTGSGWDYHIVTSENKIPSNAAYSDVLPRDGFAENKSEANTTGQIIDNRPNTYQNDVKSAVVAVYVDDAISPSSISNWFSYFKNCTEWHKMNNLDVSGCSSFRKSFAFCSCSDSLSAWLGAINTNNVEDFSYMFYSYGSLLGMNALFFNSIKNWNMSSATNLSYMFSASVLGTDEITPYLSGWDVSNVQDFGYMFRGILRYSSSSVDILDVGYLKHWKPSSATNFAYMFYPGSGVTSRNGYQLSSGFLWANDNGDFKNRHNGLNGYHLARINTEQFNDECDWSLHFSDYLKSKNSAFNYMFYSNASSITDLTRFVPGWLNSYSGYKYDPDYDAARAQLI